MTFEDLFQTKLSYDLIMIPVLLDNASSQDTNNLLENFQPDLTLPLSQMLRDVAFIPAFWKKTYLKKEIVPAEFTYGWA